MNPLDRVLIVMNLMHILHK
ncbi:hypothetical protein A2U01_0089139, partial [Trifolium medium]|nr:hypothetical protein [Trifolium medium]